MPGGESEALRARDVRLRTQFGQAFVIRPAPPTSVEGESGSLVVFVPVIEPGRDSGLEPAYNPLDWLSDFAIGGLPVLTEE